jgi:hypothetical protein
MTDTSGPARLDGNPELKLVGLSDDPEGEPDGCLQVNASIVAPYLPDIESMRYKPRQSKVSSDSDTSDNQKTICNIEDRADVS